MKLLAILLKLPRWVLSAVCLASILYLTLVPKPLPDNDIRFWEHTDKLVHAIMFGALYVCGVIDLWRLRKRPPLYPSIVLAFGVISIGGLIEILQQAMALGRGGSPADFIADVAGVAITYLLMRHLSYEAKSN